MEALPALDYKVFYERQKAGNDSLCHELAQLKKMIFGSRHERFEPTSPESSQLTLDVAAEAIAVNAKIIVAPMPVRPLEKAIAGPGLLAQVV